MGLTALFRTWYRNWAVTVFYTTSHPPVAGRQHPTGEKGWGNSGPIAEALPLKYKCTPSVTHQLALWLFPETTQVHATCHNQPHTINCPDKCYWNASVSFLQWTISHPNSGQHCCGQLLTSFKGVITFKETYLRHLSIQNCRRHLTAYKCTPSVTHRLAL